MLSLRMIGLAAVLFSAGATPVSLNGNNTAGEWPQWRGPERTAVSTETGLLKEWPEDGPPLEWQVPGIGSGYGSVAVTGGRIYLMGDRRNNQHVICLDAANGKEIWSNPVGRQGSGARSTPTVDGPLLYTLTTRGSQEADIVCLETATGKERWRKNFKREFKGRMMTSWGYSESPLVDGDRVICTPGGSDATLVALDKKTGDMVWKAQVPDGDAAGYASVIVSEACGVRQYVQLLERGIVGVRAKDGKFLWRYNRVANGTANIPTAIAKGDFIFCSTGYGAGAALLKLSPDGTDGIKAKEQYFLNGRDFQNHHGGMILLGDHIYAGHGHNQGFPICVEMATGKIAWRKDRGPGTGSAAVVYADGHIYYRFESAVMALVEATPEEYRLKGKFKIPGGSTPSWPHPVVAGGKLYLRDQDKLYCYNVKAR